MWESGGDDPWSACDENNYSGKTDAACSQREDDGTPKYHELGSGNADSCAVDPQMTVTAQTWASWTGGPMKCAPGTVTEKCCWWGRGAIQLTGPYNYGQFQKDMVARLGGKYSSLDLCADPGLICKDEEGKTMIFCVFTSLSLRVLRPSNPNFIFSKTSHENRKTTIFCILTLPIIRLGLKTFRNKNLRFSKT